MDSETENKISEAVVKILKNSDMRFNLTECFTRYVIWKSASEKNLEMNLCAPVYKKCVRKVVESYLINGDPEKVQKEKDEDPEKVQKEKDEDLEKVLEEKDQDEKKKRKADIGCDEGGLIVPLWKNRKLRVTEIGGKPVVSIYQYSRINGKEIPTSKGVSLTAEEWENCSNYVTATEEAVRKMEARLAARYDYLYKK